MEFASSASKVADLVKWRDAVFCAHVTVCVERDSTLTSGATQVIEVQFVVCVGCVLRSPSDPRISLGMTIFKIGPQIRQEDPLDLSI